MNDINGNFPKLEYQQEDAFLQNILREFDNIFETKRKLSSMYIGAVRVLLNSENPDRYSHSSNSVVNIFDELMIRIDFKISEEILEDEDLEILCSSFEEVFTKFRDKLKDDEYKKSASDRVQGNFKKLIDSMKFRVSLKKEQIANLIEICREKVDYKVIENKAVDLENLYNFFINVKHNPNINEKDFIEQLQLAKDFFKVLVKSHTILSNLLDGILKKEKKSEEDLKYLEKYFNEDQKIMELFFRKCSDSALFDWLRDKIDAFSVKKIEEPLVNDEGMLVFPIFWPLYYVNNVTKKIPEKVFPILYSIDTENSLVIQRVIISIKDLPSELINKFLPKIDKWLDLRYTNYYMNEIYSLLDILIEKANFDNAVILLRSLINHTRLEKRQSRFDLLRIEDLFEEKLDPLILAATGEILNIIENRLETLIKNDSKYSQIKRYNSRYWRYSIAAKDDIDLYADKEKNILVNIINKIIETSYSSNPELIEKKLNEYYRNKTDSIFKRIAIYFAGLFNFKPFIKEILLEKNNLLDDDIDTEFLDLLEEKFQILKKDERKRLLSYLLDKDREV